MWSGQHSTYIHTYGHCDSMTDPAQNAESVKIQHTGDSEPLEFLSFAILAICSLTISLQIPWYRSPMERTHNTRHITWFQYRGNTKSVKYF